MSQHSPRPAFASKSGQVRLSAPRSLPIIVLPGVMGSRLIDPRTDELAWNPMGLPIFSSGGKDKSPGMFAANYERMVQVAAELEPDEGAAYFGTNPTEEQVIGEINGYYGLIPEYYGRLPYRLATDLADELGPRATPRIYCCGYDWRQDNAKSAMRLARKVEQALSETGERKVIIVAHSMGGLVARYFCRVLGGEERVHRLILLASPTLGAVEAYSMLKGCLIGLYETDFTEHVGALAEAWEVIEDIDWNDPSSWPTSALDLASALGDILGSDSAQRGWTHVRGDVTSGLPWVEGSFTLPYLAMSVDRIALRFKSILTRMEAALFIRAVPSVYQLLPNRVFCRDYRRWLVFDPLKTGHAPTGFMLDTSLPRAALDETGVALTQVEATYGVGPPIPVNTGGFDENERARQNFATLGDELARVWDLITDPGGARLLEALVRLYQIVMYAQRGFIDARNCDDVYRDIHTGFLDIPALRGTSAASLALAQRFDDALTVSPRPTESVTPLDYLLEAVRAAHEAIKVLIATSSPAAAVIAADLKLDDAFDLAPADEADDRARVYMHPRSVCLYCDDLDTVGRMVVLARQWRSDGDHNVVYQHTITEPTIAVSLPGDGPNLSKGDATVPGPSSNVDDEQLSNPFLDRQAFAGVAHAAFSVDDDVIDYVIEDIVSDLEEYLRS